jgi:putative transposase
MPRGMLRNRWIFRASGIAQNEMLNREIFTTLEEARVLIEQWRREYNEFRPHSALRYRPPAPEAILTMATR